MSATRSTPALRPPTREQLLAARDGRVADVIAPDLRVLFCGINPSLYSVVMRHHFARPGNRFWPALHLSGFTPRRYAPHEQALLLTHGLGVTNVVPRATASADEVSPGELVAGGRALRRKVARLRPRVLAVLGIGAFRAAFAAPEARVGPQPGRLGDTRLWVLPNPSGLNAHYRLEQLAEVYAELRRALEADGRASSRP